MKLKLKKDIVIPAGTIFDNVDNESRKFYNGNFGFLFSLSDNTSGEVVYGFDSGFNSELDEWFEPIEE